MSKLVGQLARTTTTSLIVLRQLICRTPLLYVNSNGWLRYYCSSHNEDVTDDDVQVKDFIDRQLKLAPMGHQVMVIQPYIKWGTKKDRNTPPAIKLAESKSLVHTLDDWKIVDEMQVGLTSFRKHSFFGPGNLDLIAQKVRENKRISAIFVSTNVLKPAQHQTLENQFKVPVYDRYLIVVQIFRRHAITREAKLQVALAEVPYIWSRIRGVQEGYAERLGTEAGQIALGGNLPFDDKKNLLKQYEKKLKKSIDKLRSHREHLRYGRKNRDLPVVAVVGYTNAGKTSLVKALTGDSVLVPKNCLFATLDVTVHGGILPSNMKVLFVDTIGFISDIPTRLIEPFVATLEDAMFADVIVHVRDISHPNVQVQKEHVENTLKSLSIDQRLLEDVIDVGNKVDLVAETTESDNGSSVFVSCTTGVGLDELKSQIEKRIIAVTDRRQIKIRVRTGQDEYEWLRAHTAIVAIEPDGEHSVLEVIVTKSDLDVFKSLFIRKNMKS
ncbi:GTP-binding protein, middle domain,GTP binding domain,GTPase HflX, N-terminal,P-loop containing [Cinara cedri]|uniref:GTP-binding protein, middle domain,GTP binding domain,GTPase HflX, N-terminal,P-loop containing n=1 Tax=Cinara cedri TaxID=506608 RepID=A0A5E4NC87_9HEMI|nr:GTP-binding protein, middle domain,GTP binding domain,GTPase HflX, N-terminal,P-loop containing [Cinara cedri]